MLETMIKLIYGMILKYKNYKNFFIFCERTV